ncbi:MAG: hypothetical protein IT539_03980 [Bradyrhizobiaceae bacterium]|nr:hypothetical protein [Bradyrhizobiaceae bacterium]
MPRRVEEVRCEIRATPQDGQVRLEAMAVAGPEASGRYQFLVVKQGGGGLTRSSQGGGFSVGAGEERVLSTTVVSAGGRDRYEATLSIEWDGHKRSCSVKSDEIGERL